MRRMCMIHHCEGCLLSRVQICCCRNDYLSSRQRLCELAAWHRWS